jgi:hypothetical protein
MRAGNDDILTEGCPRPSFYTLTRFGWNDLSRNSHPLTERSGRQDPLLYLKAKVSAWSMRAMMRRAAVNAA